MWYTDAHRELKNMAVEEINCDAKITSMLSHHESPIPTIVEPKVQFPNETPT